MGKYSRRESDIWVIKLLLHSGEGMIDPDYFLRVQSQQREQEQRQQRRQRRQRRQERQRQVREGYYRVHRVDEDMADILQREREEAFGVGHRPVMLYRDLRYHPDYDAAPMDDGPPIPPLEDPVPIPVPVVVDPLPHNDPPMPNEPVANESEPLNRFGYISPRNQYILEHAIPLDENGMFDPGRLIDVEALGREFDQLQLHGRGVMRQPEETLEALEGRDFFVPMRDPDLPLPDTPEHTWFVTVRIPGYTNQYPVDVQLLNELRTLILESFEEYPSIPVMRLCSYNGRNACLLITTGKNYIGFIKQMDFYFPDSLARVMDPNLAFTTKQIFSFRKLND